MGRVELVAQDVDGGDPLDVVLSAQVGGQEPSELDQGVVALQKDGRTRRGGGRVSLWLSQCRGNTCHNHDDDMLTRSLAG